MTILLIILAIAAVFYIYAAVGYYYGFKNWYPFCGCKNGVCGTGKTTEAGTPAAPGNRG